MPDTFPSPLDYIQNYANNAPSTHQEAVKYFENIAITGVAKTTEDGS